MKKNKLKTLIAGVVLASGIAFSAPNFASAKDFTDINTNGTHNEAVQYLNELKLYEYKAGNKLNGNAPITRAEVATMLHRYYKDTQPTVRQYKNNFKDVNKNTANYADIIWSYEFGVFDGDANGKFNPQATLTRAQMAKVLVNTFWIEGAEIANFKDVNKNHWAYKYIGILQTEGITTGDGKGNFLPENKVTLNQFSSFVYRIIQAYSGDTVQETPASTQALVSLEEAKAIARNLYNSSEWEPSVTVYAKEDLEDKLTDYYFRTADVSADIKGFTRYGRTIQSDSKKLDSGIYEINIWISNNRTQEDEKVWTQKMDKAAEFIKDNYTLNTDYDIVYAVNHFIADQLDYGMRIPDNHEYLEWRGNASTCTGYSDVAAELLTRLGVENRYVPGKALYNGAGHAWNAVKIDGQWYHTDATFADGKKSFDEQYILMTESERAKTAKTLDTSFKASDIPYTVK